MTGTERFRCAVEHTTRGEAREDPFALAKKSSYITDLLERIANASADLCGMKQTRHEVERNLGTELFHKESHDGEQDKRIGGGHD
jgi:sigma54-dependent transcription regulator